MRSCGYYRTINYSKQFHQDRSIDIIVPSLRTLLFTDLGASFPTFDLILQYLLLSLEHPALLAQLRVGLLQRQEVRLHLL